jgi:DNA-binding CsgD family transcriptional regulator
MNQWNLSPAEAEVLSLLADQALTCKEAGKQLGKSYRTVENQVCRAMKKMGARSQMHAVLMWDRAHRRVA